ncbi:MAG TPA: DUF2156 domain-containing protein [Polyangia bacterium]|nr:DUF2156 domain-containing protein [Polyangia bacterium]
MTTEAQGDQHRAEARLRGRALALLRLYGWNATSFQVLEPGFSYWFDGDDACVAYLDTGRAWIAAGAPIADPARGPAVAVAFAAAAAAKGRRVSFFGTEDRFVTAVPFAAMRVGEQPVWDPDGWDDVLRGSRSLREQIRRARAKGVAVRALDPHRFAEPDGESRAAVERLVARWEAARPMPPMGFLVQIHLHTELAERRFFTAAAGATGELVGFLSMVPVFARRGWFVEDLVRLPEAPNGTAELLVDAAMRAAAAEGSRYLTLGLAPLAGRVGPWLRVARRTGGPLYDFRGVHAFKAKLRPQSWTPIFISYPRAQLGIATVYDALAAFARGGLLRFGLRTLLRRPAVLIQALALILIPWTFLMAIAPSARWFPAPIVQWGWVAFDTALAVALISLARRWRRGLDTALALLVSADAAATLGQVLAWNLRQRPLGFVTLAVSAISVAAPTLAAVLLWVGRRSGRERDRA